MRQGFTESVIEEAALVWLERLGWSVKGGPEIAPGELAAKRADFGQVVLMQRLHDALAPLNPALPLEVLDDAFHKLARPEEPTLEARNRAFHCTLVDGVIVVYRPPEARRGSGLDATARHVSSSRWKRWLRSAAPGKGGEAAQGGTR
jgi:type I restriction enzyme R subunit